ncbi:hypothetical protein LFT45_17255 [Arthrobacter sp. FW305-BF8]|uniref:hypothetical protein n=1 Tax=Arthrobacter sp. FW305-BF8 TaxID=2879617 RepID=UPI001F1CC741|nr:hypothetical protein [Arthrobacter sp. FW305-BF8]UKA53453.1 hypothetical protein LFT45_17255 [Arthrobacter sp. FW305-BF8]
MRQNWRVKLRRIAAGETIDSQELAFAIEVDTEFIVANLFEREFVALYADGPDSTRWPAAWGWPKEPSRRTSTESGRSTRPRAASPLRKSTVTTERS